MIMSGNMMWGMNLFGWIVVVLIALGIAALIKYLLDGSR